jgi:hypothetical protein
VLNKDEIENCFNSSYYLRNISSIYEKFGIWGLKYGLFKIYN